MYHTKTKTHFKKANHKESSIINNLGSDIDKLNFKTEEILRNYEWDPKEGHYYFNLSKVKKEEQERNITVEEYIANTGDLSIWRTLKTAGFIKSAVFVIIATYLSIYFLTGIDILTIIF